MKKIASLLILIVSLSTNVYGGQSDPKLPWLSVKDVQSLDEAVSDSISRKKKTVLFFWTEWDSAAREMEDYLWAPRNRFDGFRLVKVDLSGWGEQEKKLAANYNVSLTAVAPVLVMLDEQGKEVVNSRIVGPDILSENAFTLWLRDGALRVPSSMPISVKYVSPRGGARIEEVDSVFAYKVNYDKDRIVVTFDIEGSHYLFRDNFKMHINGHIVSKDKVRVIGNPLRHSDSAWGEKEVLKKHAEMEVELTDNRFVLCNTDAVNEITVYYQGANEDGVFYPPQKRTLEFKVICPI